MNGWEYKGEIQFFITGAMRTYYPDKDTGWSEWIMATAFGGRTYPVTLTLIVNKKQGGNWELIQPVEPNFSPMKPLSRDEVERLLKLPEKPSVSQ